MATRHPKKLLVEGQDDKRVIPQLMEANGVPWTTSDGQFAVFIEPYDGIDNLLAPGVLETELKASGLTTLDIVADADDNAEERWRRIRQHLNCEQRAHFADISGSERHWDCGHVRSRR